MADRFYYKDNVAYMSVTTIIGKVTPKPMLQQWAAGLAAESVGGRLEDEFDADNWLYAVENIKEFVDDAKNEYKRVSKLARNIGSIVHAYTERLDKGNCDIRITDKKYEPVWNCIDAYLKWIDVFNPEHLELEQTVYCEDPPYAGTLDRVTILNGKYRGKVYKNAKYILDYKASNGCYDPEYGMQLAAYANAYQTMTGEKIDGMAIVRLDKETGKFGFHDRSDDYQYYLDRFFKAAEICQLDDKLKLDKQSRKEAKKVKKAEKSDKAEVAQTT